MELCVNITYFSKTIGMEESSKILSEAGFKLFDYTPRVKNKNWREEMKMMQECFAKYGLSVNQSHAPFNRYKSYESAEVHKKLVMDSLDAAIIMGSKYLVVHADEFDFDNMQYSPEKALSYNYEYFAPVVEKAEKNGVFIAFENVFTDMDIPRNCSTVEELTAVIEKFNSDNVCCCWDFGHAAIAFGEKQDEAICAMKGKIKCTHVHDNYFYADMHLIPCFGKIDWKSCMSALETAGKPDVLSFELVYGDIPQKTAADTAKLLYKTGEYLLSL